MTAYFEQAANDREDYDCCDGDDNAISRQRPHDRQERE